MGLLEYVGREPLPHDRQAACGLECLAADAHEVHATRQPIAGYGEPHRSLWIRRTIVQRRHALPQHVVQMRADRLRLAHGQFERGLLPYRVRGRGAEGIRPVEPEKSMVIPVAPNSTALSPLTVSDTVTTSTSGAPMLSYTVAVRRSVVAEARDEKVEGAVAINISHRGSSSFKNVGGMTYRV